MAMYTVFGVRNNWEEEKIFRGVFSSLESAREVIKADYKIIEADGEFIEEDYKVYKYAEYLICECVEDRIDEYKEIELIKEIKLLKE